MILTVPQDGDKLYPTLGPLVCDWIEENLVFGPGDLRGQPAVLDDDKRALIWRMYEVYPKGHPFAGRRRFKRVGISLPKGLAKTEMAAWIAAAELHPEAPVRCVGWEYDKKAKAWVPQGGPVTDPYIPLVAYTEEQSDELAYGALKAILEACEAGKAFAEAWDLAFIAEYPTAGAFLEMVTDPVYREAVRPRQAAVADSRLIRMAPLKAGALFGEAD